MNALPNPLPGRRAAVRALRAVATVLAGLLVLLAPVALALAQDADAPDPPARVGSISALRGPVDYSAESGAAWDAARINQPVTGRSALWAPPGSQAEVRIGSTSVRVDGNTQAVFSQLDDHGVAIDVAQGTVRARLRSLPTGDAFSLAADGVRADAVMPGDYRADYDPDRRLLTLRAVSGRLHVVTPTGGMDLQTGQEVQVAAGGSDLQLRAMGPRDEFDRWAEARDGEQDRLAALRYVSPEMTGVESLDAYGNWQVDSDYGPIWYPSALVAGWAPYRYGHWAWVAPWGWTWVDDAPWGFAPFHYGRWARVGSRWGWVPGPVVARPVWAPALVGYVGGQPSGLNISIGIGVGSGAPVGWFPLAPYETYQPCYRHSAGYVRLINDPWWRHRRDRDGDHRWDRDRGDRDRWDRDRWDRDDRDRHDGRGRDRDDDRRMTVQPPLDYRYARLADAVTVARADDFRHSRPIGRQRIELEPRQVAQLNPVIARLQDEAAGRPAASTGRERDDRVAAAPVATLPPPPPRVARQRDDRPVLAPGQAGKAAEPRAAGPARDGREAPDAAGVRAARDGRDARDARNADARAGRDSGAARDARDAAAAKDAREARDASGPRDARDAGSATEPPRATEPTRRPTQRDDATPPARAVPPPARVAPDERREDPRAGRDRMPDRAPAPERVERPDRPADPSPRPRDDGPRGPIERRGAVPTPPPIVPALRPPVPVAPPAAREPALPRWAAPPAAREAERPMPLQDARRATPAPEGERRMPPRDAERLMPTRPAPRAEPLRPEPPRAAPPAAQRGGPALPADRQSAAPRGREAPGQARAQPMEPRGQVQRPGDDASRGRFLRQER